MQQLRLHKHSWHDMVTDTGACAMIMSMIRHFPRSMPLTEAVDEFDIEINFLLLSVS